MTSFWCLYLSKQEPSFARSPDGKQMMIRHNAYTKSHQSINRHYIQTWYSQAVQVKAWRSTRANIRFVCGSLVAYELKLITVRSESIHSTTP